MSVVRSPHDSLFKALCETKGVALDMVRSMVPERLFQKLNPESFKLLPKSFVSKELRQTHSDLVYQCQIEGHEGYVVFLLEHQSSPDELMAFRKLEYNIGIMRHQLQQGKKKLPTIINICVYHGVNSYPYSTDIFDCFSDPDLAREWMFKPFQLMDLSRMGDQEIEHLGKAALLAFLLKHSRDGELVVQVERMAMLIRRTDDEYSIDLVLEYL